MATWQTYRDRSRLSASTSSPTMRPWDEFRRKSILLAGRSKGVCYVWAEKEGVGDVREERDM